MISSQKLIYAAFFILAFAVSGFSDEKVDTATSDSLSIRFTYGPGGPIRKEKNFFAGETIFMSVQVPKQMRSGEVSDHLFEAAIVSQEKPGMKITTPRPLPLKVVLLKDDSFLIQSDFKIPVEFEKGRYDIGLSVSNLTNNIELVGKETVELRPATDFGIRNLCFFHSWRNTNWSPGSNVYGVNEDATVMFLYSGLKVNEENEVKTETKVILKDEKGGSICLSDFVQPRPLMTQKISSWEQNKFFTSKWGFTTSQPGRYTLHIEMTDLNAGKTDSVELPLRVYGMEE